MMEGATSKFSKESSINSREFFLINSKAWKLLGILPPPPHGNNTREEFKRVIQIFWSLFVNIMATFLFPLHLIVAIIFENGTKALLFENITICLTCTTASLKVAIFASNMKLFFKMLRSLQDLDGRIRYEEDQKYYTQNIRRQLNYIQWMFITVFLSVAFSMSIAILQSKGQRLIFPGWMPFDWQSSHSHYVPALGFQFFSAGVQILQNFTNDSFSPMALCVLSGHTKLLYKRVARIGYNTNMTLHEHEMELISCVAHQKNLYEFSEIIQKIISWPTFLQLSVSFANLGIAMVALLFFVTDVFYRIFYIIYFVSMIMQMFPVCYYGTDFVIHFEQLHYATFSSNWIGQTKSFKRNMMLFTERSLKVRIAMAAGIFPIYLTTFFATLKGAYSIFTVVFTMK